MRSSGCTRLMKSMPSDSTSGRSSILLQAGLTAMIMPDRSATSMMSVDSRHMRSRSAVRLAISTSSEEFR
ncbi:hypothetical protein D3C72_2310360 [compost metagenome]